MESGTTVNSSGRKTNGDSTWGTRGKGFGMPPGKLIPPHA
jgi:hypothetical protein